MKKSDLIRFRCTPEFKSDVERHAAFEKLSVSEYVQRALENEMRAATDRTVKSYLETGAVQTAPAKCEHRLACRSPLCTCGEDPAVDEQGARLREVFGPRDVEDSPVNTTTDGDRCPHGAFRFQFCGACYDAQHTR